VVYVTDYCTLKDVKENLKIVLTDTKHDSQIQTLITRASGRIDNKLARYDATVPATIPETIKNACASLVAALFRMRVEDEPLKTSAFYQDYEMCMEEYIQSQFFKGDVAEH